MLDLICFGSLNTILYPRVSFSLCSDGRFGLRRLKHESDSRISRVDKREIAGSKSANGGTASGGVILMSSASGIFTYCKS
jgi:hypothetical protein